MKNLNNITLFLLLIVVASSSAAIKSQPDNELMMQGISKAVEAYIKYDEKLFIEAKEIFEKVLGQTNSDIFALYYKTFCEFKLVEMSVQKDNEDLFDMYYDSAIVHAEKLGTMIGFESEGKTLQAGIYMMKIANSSLSAVTLSPKIHSLLDEAEEADNNNPRPYIIRGIMKYRTPGIFGGSYEDAAKNFNKAVMIFEKLKVKDAMQPNWGYLESLAWLGRTQEQLENLDAAKFAYQKALSIEPNFSWVKYSLLPKLDEKMKEQK